MPFGDFHGLLRERMGLDPQSVGVTTVDRAVRLRMSTTGVQNADDYWDRLQQSGEELQELIEAVVVPETWFFRDPQVFSTLAQVITQDWLPRHSASRLRVLSVPCSTGEEPYSIVMALLDAGLCRDQIRVDAIDISTRALARAKAASYGANSFRGHDLGFRDRYFTRTGNSYSLPSWMAEMVNFRQANLLAPPGFPSPEPYDVIFCRNLLIYFDRPTQEQALKTLGNGLASDGFLFVGAAEAFLTSSAGFAQVNKATSFTFRKAAVPPSVARFGVSAPTLPPVRKVTLPLPGRLTSQPRIAVPERPSKPAVATAPASLQEARQLADAGQITKVRECCEGHLQQHGPSPEAYYLLGLVSDTSGDQTEAARNYRKAVYLDPHHAEALLHLALIVEADGDIDAARRLRLRAQRSDQSTERTVQ